MASQAKLAAVPASALALLIGEMVDLRYRVKNVVGMCRTVEVALGLDEESFDVTISLYPGDSGEIAKHLLENAQLDGIQFTAIAVKAAPKTVQQRVVVAKVVPA